MGSNLGGDHDESISAINVTPFVDIILVVLIIFIVTTPIIMKPSINVNLPKSSVVLMLVTLLHERRYVGGEGGVRSRGPSGR